MASIENSSRFSKIVKGIEAAFADVFDQQKDAFRVSFEMWMNSDSDDAARKRVLGKAGTGFLSSFDEGDEIPTDDRLLTYETNYVHKNFGKTIEVTKNFIRDNAWRNKMNEFSDLVTSYNMSRERNAYQVLNDGFTTTDASAELPISRMEDTVPLFSTVHPRKDGGTAQSNASSTGITLTEANLDTARQAIMNQLDDKGKPMNFFGRMMLILPIALEKKGTEITGSVLQADTSNNNVNFYRGKIDVITSLYLGATNLGSDTAWFLTIPTQNGFRFINRQMIEQDTERDFNTKSLKFSVDARWSVGHEDWRGSFGTKGDGVAYSS